MRRKTAIWLAAAAVAAVVIAGGMRWIASAMRDFSCFYTPPIGSKVCDVAARDAAGWSAFWSALGFLNVFWIMMILIVLLPKRWQEK